jgi:hypothetical protein
MGTWSHGNFDNDAALDWVSEITGQLLKEISEAMDSPENLEADEWDSDVVPCKIELLCLMSENKMRPNWPDKANLEKWKTIYLNAWDSSIDALEPEEDYKTQRRIVLVEVFNRMLRCASA